MDIPYNTPEDFGNGGKPTQPQSAQPSAPKQVEEKPVSDFEAAGAKAYQSMTLGFGADLDEAISPGQGAKTRKAAAQFENVHPWASLGMDLAAGATQATALGPIGAISKVRTSLNTAASGAKIGAILGGASGAGAGGDLSERLNSAAGGALGGVLAGGALGSVTHLLGNAGSRVAEGVGLVKPAQKAADTLMLAIKASGKSIDRIQKELEADPSKYIIDVVPGLKKLMTKVQGKGTDVEIALQDALNARKSGTAARMQEGVKRADNSVKGMIDDHIKEMNVIEMEMNSNYAEAYAQKVQITPDIKKILTHPDMGPIISEAKKTLAGAVHTGQVHPAELSLESQSFNGLRLKDKKVGNTIPFMDEVQRHISQAINAAESTPGNATKVRTLNQLKSDLNSALAEQSPALASGRSNAEKLARYEESKDEAVKWGTQFAKGVNKVDLDTFHEMSDPLQKKAAQFGFLQGIKDTYLSHIGEMSTGQIQTMKTAMSSDMTAELLPKQYTTRINKMLDRELAFRKNAAEMSPRIARAEMEENKGVDSLAYAANKLGGNALGTAVKMLSKAGMSEAQAKSVVQMAATPKGFASLKASGKFTEEFMNKLSVVNRMSSGLTAATLNQLGVSRTSLKNMATDNQ